MKVLFVEDDEEIASVVREELEASGFEVRHASTLEGARAVLRDGGDFDVGLVDIGLPDGSGTALMMEMVELTPPVSSLAFTVFDDEATVLAAIDAGARGYVLKDDSVHDVSEALRACAQGESPLSGRAARHLVDRASGSDDASPLTSREIDVVVLLSKGLGYRECADLLDISLGTVQTHVKSIYRKLDVRSKAEAAAWAARKGLL